jgi:hypothetical protein
VVFLYAEDRKGEHPAAHLAEFQGVLQVDGYGGFKRLLENRPPGVIRLAFCSYDPFISQAFIPSPHPFVRPAAAIIT